jgi:hypothetical protein
MVETIMTVFALGVFIVFITFMALAVAVYFWTNK